MLYRIRVGALQLSPTSTPSSPSPACLHPYAAASSGISSQTRTYTRALTKGVFTVYCSP